EFQKKNAEVNFQTVQIGLMYDRKVLYERINQRTDEMIANGLIDEVKWLMENNYDYRKNYSIDTVGVKEVFKYFESEYSYDEMTAMIKQNTRRYAKRQMTWFRKDKRINWINVDEATRDDDIAGKALEIFSAF
ncbi:MAG: tRNA dimethylallyltransferase, partial [Ignavibacteria bacterium]